MVHCFPHHRQRATEETVNRVPEQRGLDVSFLRTLRVIQFDPGRFREGLQCAICLSRVEEGEKIRLLPKCGHGFHMECIDMWFLSHSSCPVCRKSIVDQFEMPIDQHESVTVLVDGQGASSSSLEMHKNSGRPDFLMDVSRGEGNDRKD
ncbi:RING-H2 finger protein ATL3-like [Bidens hawaiensis]|uniref:RING-H2 finger protein ATL3-like n=1 Tax=Bidens hawaiensis TaxID=980011 RepID=UPI00404A92C1